MAVNQKGRTFKISVKTRFFGESTGFTLSEKDEKDPAPDFFYVFVRLYGFEKEPDFWIIPSEIVSTILADSHKKWRETPGRNGRPHNNNSMRKLPVIITKGDVPFYPVEWEETLKKYYKNFEPLLN